jgi:uncharacterized protein
VQGSQEFGGFVAGGIAPDWTIGFACGLGGLSGGGVGAHLLPRLPGFLAMALGLAYLIQ